jgi:oligoendopeptidase F
MKLRRALTTALITGLLFNAGHVLAEEPAEEEGQAVDERWIWNLNDLYPSVEAWQTDHDKVEASFEDLKACEGKLGESAESLLGCMQLGDEVTKRFFRVAAFAGLGADADTRVPEAQQRRQAVGRLGTLFGEATSYAAPEILEMGEERINAFIEEEPGLNTYQQFFHTTLRQAPFTLAKNEEAILAKAGMLQGAAASVYQIFTGADMPWPEIVLSDGTEVRLDQAAYTLYRGSTDRLDRQLVFNEFWSKWSEFERTFGVTLYRNVRQDVFNAEVRNYPNALASALDGANIPEAVYRTLVQQTNENLDTLHRYFRLRGRMLDVEQMHYYDIYPPLVELDNEYPIEEGIALTLSAMAPLGQDYVDKMEQGFHNRWMDVYPGEGKRSGAYMNGIAYDVHPYVLMNYNSDYESVSTLAHEWGHAIHTVLAAEAQPFATYRYSIFTAEIASTVNEVLMLDHMLKVAETDEERLFYLGFALEQWRGTFFRQTMFAEFELAIHEAVEAGQTLTGASLTQMYGDILKRYHGHEEGIVNIDDSYAIEWAYIPHFYFNFYVYQYATSISAGLQLGSDILDGKEGARERYLDLLRAGGSRDPYYLLVDAGVDLASAAPYEAVFVRMNAIMDEMEAILDRQTSDQLAQKH